MNRDSLHKEDFRMEWLDNINSNSTAASHSRGSVIIHRHAARVEDRGRKLDGFIAECIESDRDQYSAP